MNHRERVTRAIEFNGPDMCPVHQYIFPGAFWEHGQKLIDLVREYPDDFGTDLVPASLTEDEAATDIIEWVDGWGTKWHRMRGYTAGEVVEPAIPNWDNWGDYQFPPDAALEVYEGFARALPERQQEWYVFIGGGGFFQHMQHMRGPANYFMDLAVDCREVHELADRMVAYNIRDMKGYFDACARYDCTPDGVFFGDDWGSQNALLIHPDMWRRFFKPRYKAMFDVVKDAGAHVWFHSDGWLWEIIDDLIEIGVDVLNPQHELMGMDRVADKVRGRCCIRTDLDRQHIIPRGTPEEVVAHVKHAIKAFGSENGGVILHGEVGQDVPFANIEAMYKAFRQYGKYPLAW